MNASRTLSTAAALAALVVGGAYAAAPKLDVAIEVAREIVKTSPDGTETVEREPVEFAHPGDVLVYTLRVRNVGDGPARNAQLEDPIPDGTTLVLKDSFSARGPARASLDGGATWQEFPATVERRREDGGVERVPAPAESYTHLRWHLDGSIDPGETREISFKVRIR